MGVGVTGVGVVVAVGVIVMVGVSVGATACATGWRMAKYTRMAPMAINSASNPNAAGKFNVITGIRLVRFIWAGLADLLELLKSLPHTRQRAASSFTRVPQVGHNFVGLDGVSGLIISYHQAILCVN